MILTTKLSRAQTGSRSRTNSSLFLALYKCFELNSTGKCRAGAAGTSADSDIHLGARDVFINSDNERIQPFLA